MVVPMQGWYYFLLCLLEGGVYSRHWDWIQGYGQLSLPFILHNYTFDS